MNHRVNLKLAKELKEAVDKDELLVDNPNDWKNELSWWFFEADYDEVKEMTWLTTIDTSVDFEGLIKYIEQLIQLHKTGFEGKSVDGNFYLKQPDGKYYSVNTMTYLEETNV
jgi:hypothetical protein